MSASNIDVYEFRLVKNKYTITNDITSPHAYNTFYLLYVQILFQNYFQIRFSTKHKNPFVF